MLIIIQLLISFLLVEYIETSTATGNVGLYGMKVLDKSVLLRISSPGLST
jgi:hypothetical protein